VAHGGGEAAAPARTAAGQAARVVLVEVTMLFEGRRTDDVVACLAACYCLATKLKNSRTLSLAPKNASTLSPLVNSTNISYFRNSPDPS
jgi:hypothetical protein